MEEIKRKNSLKPILNSLTISFFNSSAEPISKDEALNHLIEISYDFSKSDFKKLNYILNGCKNYVKELPIQDMTNLFKMIKKENLKLRLQTIFGGYTEYPFSSLAYFVPSLQFGYNLLQYFNDFEIDYIFMKNTSSYANKKEVEETSLQIKTLVDYVLTLIKGSKYACLLNKINFLEDDLNFKLFQKKQQKFNINEIKSLIMANPSLYNNFINIVKNNESTLDNSISYALFHFLYQDLNSENYYNKILNNDVIPNFDAENNTLFLYFGATPEKIFYCIRNIIKEHYKNEIKPSLQIITNFKRAPYILQKNSEEIKLNDYLKKPNEYNKELDSALLTKYSSYSKFSIATLSCYAIIKKELFGKTLA